MVLRETEATNFRSYSQIRLRFGQGKNILFGRNAQGKTNLLEAIYITCLSKSFRTNIDYEEVRFDAPGYTLTGLFVSNSGAQRVVTIHYSREQGKAVAIDRKRLDRVSALVGQFPVVAFTPEDYQITWGAPAERRRFLDILLSQLSASYLADLQDYSRVLRQRNRLLLESRQKGGAQITELEPWDANLIQCGARLMRARANYLGEFATTLQRVIQDRVRSIKALQVSYKPSFTIGDFEATAEDFEKALRATRKAEVERGMTLIGPHRDDLAFLVDGIDLRRYGSIGQHKAALMALRIAEYHFLKEKKTEDPILLCDDLASYLDSSHAGSILSLMEGLGQVFITTTVDNPREVYGRVLGDEARYFRIEAGTVTEV